MCLVIRKRLIILSCTYICWINPLDIDMRWLNPGFWAENLLYFVKYPQNTPHVQWCFHHLFKIHNFPQFGIDLSTFFSCQRTWRVVNPRVHNQDLPPCAWDLPSLPTTDSPPWPGKSGRGISSTHRIIYTAIPSLWYLKLLINLKKKSLSSVYSKEGGSSI